MTLRKSLQTAYEMKLADLRKEIGLYSDEESIWKIEEGISNSGGNLCLHLVGNLNHFVGAILGNTGYVRERDLEFSEKGVSKEELIESIDAVNQVVMSTLDQLSDAQLEEPYPEKIFDKDLTSGEVLAYMSGHLSYHLGQLNYHRRLFDK